MAEPVGKTALYSKFTDVTLPSRIYEQLQHQHPLTLLPSPRGLTEREEETLGHCLEIIKFSEKHFDEWNMVKEEGCGDTVKRLETEMTHQLIDWDLKEKFTSCSTFPPLCFRGMGITWNMLRYGKCTHVERSLLSPALAAAFGLWLWLCRALRNHSPLASSSTHPPRPFFEEVAI